MHKDMLKQRAIFKSIRFYLLLHKSEQVFGFPFAGVPKGKLAISAKSKGMNTVSVNIWSGQSAILRSSSREVRHYEVSVFAA